MRSPSVTSRLWRDAEDAERHRQRAGLLLVRRRVLQVQHVAERRRREVGEQLLLVLGQLVDAVGQQRDRDRPARGAARRVDGDVDGVGELLALAAPLACTRCRSRARRRGWRSCRDRPCGRSAPPGCPCSSSCSMRQSASVVLPEPEPPSTAPCRFRTFMLSVIGFAAPPISRPARMLVPLVAVLVEDAPKAAARRRWLAAARRLVAPNVAQPTAPAVHVVPRRSRPGAGGRRPSTRRRTPVPPARGAASVRPSRSRRRSWTIEIRFESSLALSNHASKPGVVLVVGVELAHRHHALPLGDRHQHLAAAAVAELAEGLRRLVLLVRREVARAQHDAGSCRPSPGAPCRADASSRRPGSGGCRGRRGPRSYGPTCA